MSRVLVIDDNLSTADTVEQILRLAGFDAFTAPSGRDGLNLARRQLPDLILSDLCMPGMSGIEVLHELRANGDFVPFVLASGWLTANTIVDAMRLGAVNCVDWPLSEEDLLRVVKDGLAQGPEAVDRLEAHAAARWASAVVQVLGSSRDLTTCAEWGRHVGISERTLQNLCRRAGLSPRRSLLLARLLRAVWNRQRHGWRLEHSLATADDRTLRRLFHLGGSRTGASQNVAGDVRELVDEQALIQDPVALREIRRLLNTRISVKS